MCGTDKTKMYTCAYIKGYIERGIAMPKPRGPTKKQIRDAIELDLKNQLFASGNIGKQYDNLISDYMYFYDLKEKLQKDIKKNGLRVKTKNGNGIESEKDNASVGNLLKVNTQMLKILSDLNLKEPVSPTPIGGEPDDLLSRN